MSEPIIGYNPIPVDECPSGGGHQYLEIYKTHKLSVLKCINCEQDTVSYTGDPWWAYGGLGGAKRFMEGQ